MCRAGGVGVVHTNSYGAGLFIKVVGPGDCKQARPRKAGAVHKAWAAMLRRPVACRQVSRSTSAHISRSRSLPHCAGAPHSSENRKHRAVPPAQQPACCMPPTLQPPRLQPSATAPSCAATLPPAWRAAAAPPPPAPAAAGAGTPACRPHSGRCGEAAVTAAARGKKAPALRQRKSDSVVESNISDAAAVHVSHGTVSTLYRLMHVT